MSSVPFLLISCTSQWKLTIYHNHFSRSWDIIVEGVHKRLVNDILGLLLKQHFPGLVDLGMCRRQSPQSFAHYAMVPDHGGVAWQDISKHGGARDG